MDAAIINGGVALVGIFVGYLGGVRKGKADLDVERERSRQLREDRDAEHLKHRMAVYHDALNAATDVVHILQSGPTVPEINHYVAKFEKHVNGVLAFGHPSVDEPAREMLSALRAYDFRTDDLTEYYAARDRFSAAANADVGPGPA